MKAWSIIPIVVSGYATLYAQESKDIEVKNLRTPASPGFVLMDQAPSSVDKPTTPKGFALGVLNLGQGGAVEAAPYWLVQHPNLSFQQYAYNPVPLISTFAVSLTTVKKNDSTLFGFGARAQLLKLRGAKSRQRMQEVYDSIATLLNELTPANIKTIQKFRKSIQSMLEKPTFTLEGAYSYLSKSPGEGSYDNLTKARTGVWLTALIHPSYKSSFDIILVGRWINNADFTGYEKNSTLFDVGARGTWTLDAFGLSLEYVNRQQKSGANVKNSYDRVAGIVEYKLDENVYLTATYGKNFDSNNSIIALLGINFGFASKALITN